MVLDRFFHVQIARFVFAWQKHRCTTARSWFRTRLTLSAILKSVKECIGGNLELKRAELAEPSKNWSCLHRLHLRRLSDLPVRSSATACSISDTSNNGRDNKNLGRPRPFHCCKPGSYQTFSDDMERKKSRLHIEHGSVKGV